MSTKVQELVEKARWLTPEERRELIAELQKQPETPKQPPRTEAERIALIRSVCGKYAHVPTSSSERPLKMRLVAAALTSSTSVKFSTTSIASAG
jgi:hypothetical protein